MENHLNQIEQVLLDLIANALFNAKREIPKKTDWKQIYRESQKQTVTALAFRGATEAGISLPNDVEKVWRDKVVASCYQGMRITANHHLVDELMKNANIPYVILKGCASALYYPDPLERMMGDVDFLIRKSDLKCAGAVLEQEGFLPWEEEHICHVVYRKDMIHLEMHFEPSGMPYGRAGQLMRGYLSDIMECANEVVYEEEPLRFPSPFHHGLILLMHTVHHMLGEGIGLRHLCDWAVFATSFSAEEFREIFEVKLKNIGLWEFACILSQTAEQWLGCPHREWTGSKNEKLTEQVLMDIFTGGNFGQKKEGRVYETYLISSRGKAGVGHTSMIRQIIISINEMVMTHWPIANRNKLLLLAGWLYFGFRYVRRIQKGERPSIHLLEICGTAAERKNIYKEFHLYEPSQELE